MALQFDAAAYPTPSQIRDQILRTIRLAYRRRNLTANVKVGSEHYITATALADVIAVGFANARITLRDVSPLDAVGVALRKLCKIFGVPERPAQPALGLLKVTCLGTVTIPAGFRASAGAKYETTKETIVTATGFVRVVALEPGTAGNAVPGTILTWDSGSIGGLNPNAVVDVEGLDGGSEGDTDDTLRARLIERLAFPGAGGNWAQVKGWSEEASAAVQRAYVYSAARGPSSTDVALVKEAGDRTLNATIVGDVGTYVAAKVPGNTSWNFTSVEAEEVDVVIKATLPLPQNAGGAGGGWLDATPWPSTLAKVTAWQSNGPTSYTLTVETADDAPGTGQHIGIFDPTINSDDTRVGMLEMIVTGNISAVVGGFEFDVYSESALSDEMLGAYISAGAVNLASYAEVAVEQFEKLGPGEKTTDTNLVPRALRKPAPGIIAASDITSLQLAGIQSAHPEIMNLEYEARFDTGTTDTRTSPSIPPTTADAPRIIVLKHLAFRKN